jgi:hypothetical protein
VTWWFHPCVSAWPGQLCASACTRVASARGMHVNPQCKSQLRVTDRQLEPHTGFASSGASSDTIKLLRTNTCACHIVATLVMWSHSRPPGTGPHHR